jgi:hypothetical protein
MAKATSKRKYLCVDGPMRGHYIYLQTDCRTLVFEMKEHKGRYVPNGISSVRWEAA